MEKIITRFAPSPTGTLHLGGARTALFNFLFSRHHRGQFILRVEDTDRTRSTDEYTQDILGALTWLGIKWDEGPYYQSQRMDLYHQQAEHLISEGKAYRCYCTADELEARRQTARERNENTRYDGHCRDRRDRPDLPFVVRFRTPQAGATSFADLIHGPITFVNSELDDLVIIRADQTPTYNFSVVIDDVDMAITHVIRGDDHINNTPRQILIYQALGLTPPLFAHLPMIHGADRTKLSKRHGAKAVIEYRREGYLPQAMNNYLARLGWGYGDEEIFSPEELIEKFDLKDVSKSAAIFNPEKLLWLNHQYLMKESNAGLLQLARPFLDPAAAAFPEESLLKVAEIFKPRAKTLVELNQQSRFFFVDAVEYEPEAVQKFFTPDVKNLFYDLIRKLKEAPAWKEKEIEDVFRNIIQAKGIKMGKIAQAVRVALTGKSISPGLFEIMGILGKEKTLVRIESALSKIPAAPPSPSEDRGLGKG
jgi:glutamyl-tRNA synthetase